MKKELYFKNNIQGLPFDSLAELDRQDFAKLITDKVAADPDLAACIAAGVGFKVDVHEGDEVITLKVATKNPVSILRDPKGNVINVYERI